MRVDCPHCLEKAIITSSNQLCDTVKDLYCQCMNTSSCGASFVFTLAYKHDLNPSVKSTQQLAANLLSALPLDQRRKLFQEQQDLF